MKTYQILLVLNFIFLFSCEKNDDEIIQSETVTGDPIGLISYEDFIASTPPTYKEFMLAYDTITSANPDILNDEQLLAREIFDYITLNDSLEMKSMLKSFDYYVYLLESLTVKEWHIALSNPIDAALSFPTMGKARGASIENFPCERSNEDFDGSKANAVHHAYWNALMARRSNSEFAELMANAHEDKLGNITLDKPMDLHNNEFGRNLEKMYPDATDDELLELLLEQKYIFVEREEDIPDYIDALVYIKGKREFDVVLQGSLSNPDSGGDWDMIMYLSQCDNVLRGRYEITRDSTLQQRRFSGIIEDDVISLDVSAPFVFENPDGITYCESMKMTLSGNSHSLNGSWTSPNCSKGGSVSLAE